MSTLETLKQYVNKQMGLHPEYKSEIIELYQLCLDEIEQGGSVEHECSLCQSDIEEIIKL
jgi:hypothetical protein